ncbi:alpha/beta fold hydrolase [Nocardioides sp. CFH 31398]|uniref:alpha/beta fold hydrolase n=1 Tax=Nocardioides sp. CFH 31398 TaxID=2919579 RepID=UPI001F061665|nr:alpha/beta fold hydrolase [Nocardioides sp. CFH 31398]MCH1867485.1 alpha/beta fold hydrolase [Nocardioides sp. CFH 31398]
MSALRTVGTGPVPRALPGLDPTWSRTVVVPDSRGVERTWHLLDNGAEPVHGTLVCVHGNPTWSYLWRHLLAGVPDGWRVVAPDQLGMGFSERLGDDDPPYTVAERVADLGRLTDALGIDGPVVSVGHDWGGIISLGWALGRRDRLRGIVVGNTAVAQPPGDFGPPLIRLAHTPGVRPFGCVATPIFVRATSALSSPALPKDVRDALALPYGDSHHRRSVGDFVADIPFSPGHPSYPAVATIAEDIRDLDVPALMMWGPRDPVFGERYLRDLRDRLPRAQVHRFEGASHLVTEDAPEHVDAVAAFLDDLLDPPADARPVAESSSGGADRMWTALDARADDDSVAVAAGGATVSWRDLATRVTALAAGLRAAGVRPGDRIGLLVEPSTDLTTIVYAAWRAGAVVVVADKGLGFAGMRRALRGATLDHVVGRRTGLAAARAMGLPGSRISVDPLAAPVALLLGVSQHLDGLVALGAGATAGDLPEPDLDADCAILFTSGATGPAKGVAYTHRQARAEVDLVRATYDLGPDDAFVAAFAPFALFGPAFGLASAVPAIDVTAPDTLTAPLLADAVAAVDARVVFASPAALRRVVATREETTDDQRAALAGVRLLMSAGAPVPLGVLEQVAEVLPGAALHTPYGMTEALPATDVSLDQIREAGPGEGVCVGWPLEGVSVGVVPFGEEAAGPLETAAGTGEICVRAAHVKDRYDDLWLTQRRSTAYAGWHRTGDVGHLDDAGRLWVEGRLAHVVRTADGVVTPVGVEQRAETVDGVSAAAAVGVGPEGTQQLVVVVVGGSASSRRSGPRGPLGVRGADLDLADAVRAAVGRPVAAVLVADRLPLDVRHASKVDRAEVARQAARALAGRP